MTTSVPSLQAQDTLFQAYEQAQTDVLLSQSKLSAAKKLQGQLKGQTAQFPTRGLDDGRLQRTADLNRQLYTSLQAALNAARLQKDNATSNVQLVQSATADPAPVDPNPLRNLAVGAAVGIVLSLAAVMLLEQADRRVRNVDDLRALVSGPIIGALPQMSRARIRAVGEGRPALSDAEAFNLASANLGLTLRWATPAGGWENRVVLVTSALPGEGKSVTAAGIARSLALTGRKVVLINADLRRPTLDKMFPSKDNIGLGDVLEGRVWPTDALRPSEYDNLQILHSGNVRSNPASLFSRPQMAGLLQGLRRTYDVILIDTPACAVVADALLLAPHADCVLHVVGAGQVDQDAVRSATASLSAAAPNTIAYVLNRAPRSRQDNIYYAQPRHRAPTPTTPDVPDALTRTMELRLADLAHAVQDKQDKIGEPPRADETKNTGETHE